MARPKIRTCVVESDSLVLLKQAFGTATNAYKLMRLGQAISYPAFLRAWSGKEVTPQDRDSILEGWESWALRMVQTLREAQKPPVAQMFTPAGTQVIT